MFANKLCTIHYISLYYIKINPFYSLGPAAEPNKLIVFLLYSLLSGEGYSKENFWEIYENGKFQTFIGMHVINMGDLGNTDCKTKEKVMHRFKGNHLL